MLALLFISFIAGNCLQFVGFRFFKHVAWRIWKAKLSAYNPELSNMESKNVLVRQYSPANYEYVELWYAYRGMSFNLSISMIILFVAIAIKLTGEGNWSIFWLIIEIIIIVAGYILLERANMFHIWAVDTTQKTLEQLNLVTAELSGVRSA